jgi:hypothetical protein
MKCEAGRKRVYSGRVKMASRKELMNAKLGILFTTACFMTTTILAQEKPQLAMPKQILANPDYYQGKVVALHGVVDKVSFEHKTFTMIDLNRVSSAAGTNVQSVIVTNQGGSQLPIPKTGQEAVVIGQIARQDDATRFTAAQVFTNREEVQQILAEGSIVRRPGKRPGDNLGRDAQPANNLDR